MKTEPKIAASVVVISLCFIGTLFGVNQVINNKNESRATNSSELKLSDNKVEKTKKVEVTSVEEANEATEEIVEATEITEVADAYQVKNDENIKEEPKEEVVYDGLTRTELIDKLNRNLNSTLSGKGELFADYSLKLGLDPYLALAIVLHETGCSWDCSELVKACNNVGGQKGSPNCGGGSYMAFDSLDDGIRGFMDNLYNNFYALGLTTPETINPRYAASTAWAGSINKYIEKIKAS